MIKNNKRALKQARQGIIDTINSNPSNIRLMRKTMIDGGFGKLVQNPESIPNEYDVKCRIFHEQKGTFTLAGSNVGFNTNLGRSILVNYKTIIQENDYFIKNNITWRLGPVDPLYNFGGITGYQSPLEKAGNV